MATVPSPGGSNGPSQDNPNKPAKSGNGNGAGETVEEQPTTETEEETEEEEEAETDPDANVPPPQFNVPAPASMAVTDSKERQAASTLEKAVLRWYSVIPPMMGELQCQFNPSSLAISKETKWNAVEAPSFNAPILHFGGGQSATYKLSLFFDSYANLNATKAKNNQEDQVDDVRQYTNQLFRMTLRGAGYSMFLVPYAQPPFVQFIWGNMKLFTAVVTKVEVSYIMFAPNGTPIRAKAEVEFRQQDPSEDILPAQNPTSRTDSRKTRIVNSRQRLDLIAYEEYGDSRYWRVLADANLLDDPFQLQDGQLLVIPQITNPLLG